MRSVFVTIALVVSFCTLAVTGTMAFVNHRASVAMSHAAQAENAAVVMDLLGAQLAGAVRFSRAEQITPQVDALVETSRGDATDVLVVSVTGDAMVALGSDEALAGLAGAAVALLPVWARWSLRLPVLPGADDFTVRPAGEVVTRTLRWAMSPHPSEQPAPR
jgi:hypothetical protein